MAAADTPEAAGRAPADLALVILAAFVAVHLDAVVRGGWLIGAGEIGDGLGLILGRLGQALQAPLIALVVGVVAITAAAGKKRSLGADSDLACVAFVPAVVVAVAGALIGALVDGPAALGIAFQAAALAWYAIAVVLAISRARFYRDGGDAPYREADR
jgi:hypothetical protein